MNLDQLVKEAELKKKACERREASDEILENVFSTLMANVKKKKE